MKPTVAIFTAFIIVVALLALKGPILIRQTQVKSVKDTVYVITHDTVTVVSRAQDTVRVVVREVGPLTERMLTHIICGKEMTYGDDRDAFGFNGFGMVFCPRKPE